MPEIRPPRPQRPCLGVALSDDARVCMAEFQEVHRLTHKLIADMVDGVPWLFMYDRRKAAK